MPYMTITILDWNANVPIHEVHLSRRRGSLLTRPHFHVLSCSQSEIRPEDICFMSAGSVALGSGVIRLHVSVGGWNTEFSFLKEMLGTSVPTAWGGAREKEEEKYWREVEGRGWVEERQSGETVCEAISPWQGPRAPRGGLGATRLQPQCSVLPLSPMTLLRHVIAKAVDNIISATVLVSLHAILIKVKLLIRKYTWLIYNLN